mmetsp:Transcript_23103/g.41719  ORF Transcript_23103/g.41719 Transcript_23103/m.41719 type:complete len:120 (+) Transcript_23103:329-688(+)
MSGIVLDFSIVFFWKLFFFGNCETVMRPPLYLQAVGTLWSDGISWKKVSHRYQRMYVSLVFICLTEGLAAFFASSKVLDLLPRSGGLVFLQESTPLLLDPVDQKLTDVCFFLFGRIHVL